MTTIIANAVPEFTTPAAFRATMKTVSDAFIACGWARSADTGVIDFTTVSNPTAGNQSMGYEIFIMQDALQATAPCFVKVEYGSGPPAGSVPGIWITIGTGSNGAGTLTGNVGTRNQIFANNSNGSLYPCHFSGANNRMGCVMFVPIVFGGIFWTFFLERSHNASGVDTSAGFMLVWNSGDGTGGSEFIPSSGAIPATYTHWNCVLPPSGTGASGANISVYPVRGWTPDETAPMLGCFVYFNADLTNNVAVPVTAWDGVLHTSLPLSCGTPSLMAYGGSGVLMMRWE